MTDRSLLSEALALLGPTLAIDSSLGTAVAVSDGETITVAFEDDPLAHAEVIGILIERAITDAELTPREIANVVIGVGPGPFTGLRVGIAAAHGFAIGIGREPLGMISHEAVAHTVFQQQLNRGEVVVVTDARRRESFVTRFRAPDRSAVPIREEGPGLAPAADWSDGSHLHAALIERPERISAGALIELAALRRSVGIPFEPPQAVYLRSPDVTLPGAPKRVSS